MLKRGVTGVYISDIKFLRHTKFIFYRHLYKIECKRRLFRIEDIYIKVI